MMAEAPQTVHALSIVVGVSGRALTRFRKVL